MVLETGRQGGADRLAGGDGRLRHGDGFVERRDSSLIEVLFRDQGAHALLGVGDFELQLRPFCRGRR